MVYKADEALCDHFGRLCGDGHAFKINHKKIRGKQGSKSFAFVDDFAFLNQQDNQQVLMARISNGHNTYDVYAEFHLDDESLNGSPKKQLRKKAYTNKGGPVDTENWQYAGQQSTPVWIGYLLPEGALDDGYQVGLDEATFEFALIGPGFQIGEGANGKNINFGASAWLRFFDGSNGRKLGRGNINIDLATAPVPLPNSMPLFLSATAGLLLVNRSNK